MKWTVNNKQEKIYIIDATNIPVGVVCATANGDKIFINSYKESELNSLPGDTLQLSSLANFLNKLKISNNSKVIFLWNGSNAATFTADVSLKKQHSNIPLTEVDINRIFETATFQFFTQFREEAKKRFKVDDIGLVLASNRILDFKLDGETYINIESVKAKRADVAIEQTFIRRQLHEVVSDQINPSINVLHVEIGTALSAMAKVSGVNISNPLILYIDWNKSHIYYSEESDNESIKFNSLLKYAGDINIGIKDIYESLNKKLGIKASNADVFIDMILKEGASTRFSSGVKRAILGVCVNLLSECRNKVPGAYNVILFAKEPLATFMSQNDFARNLECNIFTSLNRADILHQEITVSKNIESKALSPVYFAGLIAYWSRLGDNNTGGRNRGNVGWLISHNSI